MDRIRVLIADDSSFVREGMRVILELDEQFEVIGCAENGKEAIEIAMKNTCDVALMDIQMPVMDIGIHPNDNFNTHAFSAREMEIIEAVAEGLSNKEIASKLFISEGTVKNYISTILDKEGLAHRTQLAVYYLTGRK